MFGLSLVLEPLGAEYAIEMLTATAGRAGQGFCARWCFPIWNGDTTEPNSRSEHTKHPRGHAGPLRSHHEATDTDLPASLYLFSTPNQAMPILQTRGSPGNQTQGVLFFFRHIQNLFPAAVAIRGAAGAHRLSAASPAPPQKWGEWRRCCQSRPWWPPS